MRRPYEPRIQSQPDGGFQLDDPEPEPVPDDRAKREVLTRQNTGQVLTRLLQQSLKESTGITPAKVDPRRVPAHIRDYIG